MNEERFIDIETKLAYQEKTIKELNGIYAFVYLVARNLLKL